MNHETTHYVLFSSFLLLSPSQVHISFSTLLLNALNMTQKISHPYKTMSRIIVLCILTFMHVANRKTKILNWMVANIPRFNLPLVSSWMHFLCVNTVPKYLNFGTFSKDLLAILCCDFVLQSIDETNIHLFSAFTSNQSSH